MRGSIFLLGALLLAPCAAGARALTPAAIAADLHHLGARRTVARLNAGKAKEWEAVLRHIQTGQREWLLVARPLKAGTDAGTGEGLDAAIAHALARNPAEVLKLQPDFALAKICTNPDIEPSEAEVMAFKAHALAALDRVTDPGLAHQVQECRKMEQAS